MRQILYMIFQKQIRLKGEKYYNVGRTNFGMDRGYKIQKIYMQNILNGF